MLAILFGNTAFLSLFFFFSCFLCLLLFSFFGFFLLGFLFFLSGGITLHLFKLNFFLQLQIQFLEQISQHILEDRDRFDVIFIEINPYLDTITRWIVHLRRDESESIYCLTTVEILSQKEKCQLLVDLLLVGLSLGHLKNKSSSFLIIWILPLRLYPVSKKLNRVNFLKDVANSVSQ